MTTRPIGELLRLDTYEDMTDDEINLIIDHKCNEAVNAALEEYKANESAALISDYQSRVVENMSTSEALLARIAARAGVVS